MIAMSLEGSPVHVDLDCRLYFAQRRIGTYLDLLRCRPPHLRIVVARGLKLGQRELLIVQDHRRGIMTGNQRIELSLVSRKLAVQIERRLAQGNTNLFHLGGIDFVPFDEIEDGGVHALDRGSGWPKAQRDPLELPAPSEVGSDRLRLAAIRVNIVKAAVRGGEKFACRQKLLLSEERC